MILFFGVEAGTRLVGKLVMSVYCGAGVLLLQFFQKFDEGGFLLIGSGIYADVLPVLYASRRATAYIAYSYGASVMPCAVCACD